MTEKERLDEACKRLDALVRNPYACARYAGRKKELAAAWQAMGNRYARRTR